jgi:hypothetical protein
MGEALPHHRLDPVASPRPRSAPTLGSPRRRRGGPLPEGAGEGAAHWRAREMGDREAEEGGRQRGERERERRLRGMGDRWGWWEGREGKIKLEYDKWAPPMLVGME